MDEGIVTSLALFEPLGVEEFEERVAMQLFSESRKLKIRCKVKAIKRAWKNTAYTTKMSCTIKTQQTNQFRLSTKQWKMKWLFEKGMTCKWKLNLIKNLTFST